MHFTFQSGSIQINLPEEKPVFLVPLHSNLVLFKLSSLYLSYSFQPSFTFQSGSIQMR